MIYIIGGVVLAVIAGLWVFGYRMRRAGEDSMAAKVTEKSAETLKNMDAAAAKAPKTKDELVKRLREGGL